MPQPFDPHEPTDSLVKDEILHELASNYNVAQFVSFSAGTEPRQRFCRILGHPPNYSFDGPAAAIAALFDNSPEGQVNIRTYKPSAPKDWPFEYGLADRDEVLRKIRKYARNGLFTIVNETIDVKDGGVSGVAESGIVEFAPGVTPRGVDRAETTVASMPREMGLWILTTVYGFRPAVDFGSEYRVEFSIHPLPRGYRQEHTIVWELQRTDAAPVPNLRWPNDFSELLGDKAFGLLVAGALGFPVPRTTVIPRGIAPFCFGQDTGTSAIWLRTCPRRREPSRFPTCRGWRDPYTLLATQEDGERIASVLAQQEPEARYSGGLVTNPREETTIDVYAGFGDRLMLSEVDPMDPEQVPDEVKEAVRGIHDRLIRALGPVTTEWVFDGDIVWIVQANLEVSAGSGDVIVEGEIVRPYRFRKERGPKALKALIEKKKIQGSGRGIIVLGTAAQTGHIAAILRDAEIPSRFEAPPVPGKPAGWIHRLLRVAARFCGLRRADGA